MENKKEVSLVKRQASQAEIQATNLTIKNSKDLEKAVDLLSKIKRVGKMIKEAEEKTTINAKAIIKNARELFRPIQGQYEEAERIVKAKMVEFDEKETEKADKKNNKIIDRVERGEIDFEKGSKKIEANVAKRSIETKGGAKIQFRIHREVVIENDSLLPRNYLVPHTTKIRIDALKGIEIPGVKVVEKKIVAGSS